MKKANMRAIKAVSFLLSLLLTAVVCAPVRVMAANTGDKFTIAAGAAQSVAIKKDGSLWDWGSSSSTAFESRPGTSVPLPPSKPVKTIMDDAVSVSASYHTLAIKKDGSLWAWGSNSVGQVGDGTKTNRPNPIKIMEGVSFVSAGGYHSMVIKKDGTLWVWGDNSEGQLGDGTKTNRLKPVKIMDDVAYASAGNLNSFAVKKDGTLWAWGRNGGFKDIVGHKLSYQLLGGVGTKDIYLNPVKVMDGVSSVSTKYMHTLAVKKDGTLWAWGWNASGVLGDGTSTYKNNPVKIMDGVISASAGYEHSLAVKKDGTLWTWGDNFNGQVGDGTMAEYRTKPIKIMDNVVSASAGNKHSLAVKKDGTLWAWGDNTLGKLGNGDSSTNRFKPVKIMDGVALPK